MRLLMLLIGVLVCGAWGRVSDGYEFNAESESGVILYESISDVDLIIRRLDMDRRQPAGRAIMLPATHRINAVSMRRNHNSFSDDEWAAFLTAAGHHGSERFNLSFGFKEVEPGFYAIVDAYSSSYVQLGGGGTNGGCIDYGAPVIEVRRGEVSVLPRSLYGISDQRQGGRTGIGEEQFSVAKATAVLAAYPNVNAEIRLLQATARASFSGRRSMDILRESCASGDSFEIIPLDGPDPRKR